MQSKLDEKYMKMCLSLAKKGKSRVRPNPLVGCVILDKDGNIVSTGYHKKYGENHAERDALLKLKKGEAKDGTLYVNLEPCSHYGKTPPCTDLIIEHGLRRVVIAMRDVNPKVDGVKKLSDAGIEITEGVLENEARFLNRVFIKNIVKRLPYVVLKTAVTMDGKIASKTGSSKWITSEKSREDVYKMRKEFDCIMTSSNTVISDNPSMEHKFKCVLDKDFRTNPDSKIYKQGEIYIATKENTPLIDGMLDIKSVLKELYKKGIYTVFVECGGTLAGSMLKNNLIDEVYQFIAPKILNDNDGMSSFNGEHVTQISQAKKLEIYKVQKFGSDILIKAMVLQDFGG